MVLGLMPVLMIAGGGPALTAAQITMHDGRVLEGEIISEPGSAVVDLRVDDGSMRMTMHLRRNQIRSIDFAPSADEVRAEELAGAYAAGLAADDVDILWQVVEGYRAIDRDIAADDAARAILDRDRHHEGAHRQLGHRLYQGVWMEPDELALAQGKVRYDGRWMSWAEVEAAQAEEAERLAARAERRAEQAERRAERAAARRARAYDPIASPAIYRYGGVLAGHGVIGWRRYGYGGYPVHLPYRYPSYGHGHGYRSGGYIGYTRNTGSSRWRVSLRW